MGWRITRIAAWPLIWARIVSVDLEVLRTRIRASGSLSRVRSAAGRSHTLDERLQAARSNLRFTDRRVADPEAALVEPASFTNVVPLKSTT
jgi:hypothetical protein